jgi:hypothetical protein
VLWCRSSGDIPLYISCKPTLYLYLFDCLVIRYKGSIVDLSVGNWRKVENALPKFITNLKENAWLESKLPNGITMTSIPVRTSQVSGLNANCRP